MLYCSLQQLSGNWKQVEQQGLSEFLEAQGIGWIKRNIAIKCGVVDTITITEDLLTISYAGY